MMLAVIRVRGTVNIKHDIKHTLELMNLNRPNHCVIITDSPNNIGMIKKVNDYVTWGEVDAPTLEELIRTRGRLEGDIPVTDEYLVKNTEFKTVADASQAMVAGKVQVAQVPGLKKVFRLSPPKRGGYEGIKRAYSVGGALGHRGEDINQLIRRMV